MSGQKDITAVWMGIQVLTWTRCKLVIPSRFISWKNSFSDINRKCILPNKIGAVTAPILFGKMHFLLISANWFTREITVIGMTSFMEFMFPVISENVCFWFEGVSHHFLLVHLFFHMFSYNLVIPLVLQFLTLISPTLPSHYYAFPKQKVRINEHEKKEINRCQLSIMTSVQSTSVWLEI